METKTLRDELALAATKEEIEYQINTFMHDPRGLPKNPICVARYMHADAMLRARSVGAEYEEDF